MPSTHLHSIAYREKKIPTVPENAVLLTENKNGDGSAAATYILHPYRHANIAASYDDNAWLEAARAVMEQQSLDRNFPNGVVIVQDGNIVASGANGSAYHDTKPCVRKERGIPTGEGYDLCEGCHPKNHGEASAIADARARGVARECAGATAYLYGHWWACAPCYDLMEDAGIRAIVFSRRWTADEHGVILPA